MLNCRLIERRGNSILTKVDIGSSVYRVQPNTTNSDPTADCFKTGAEILTAKGVSDSDAETDIVLASGCMPREDII
jgi:hypothetical protein